MGRGDVLGILPIHELYQRNGVVISFWDAFGSDRIQNQGGMGSSGSPLGRSICVPMRRPTILSLLEILVDADPSQFELANSVTVCQAKRTLCGLEAL